ncbi:hypothetical protein POM88_021968 [Heracleum sosnowskyi]|uniref:Uncharacterized protein n=1 Tax=Heracleum sosnowskyi TaxID=360622 RepID=A0AAD8IFL5_9APIA|nr:hypothetical protein POM88_021968 [Heracleum sosnowskyi]
MASSSFNGSWDTLNLNWVAKVGQLQPDQSVRLPRQISDPLLYEMEDCILEAFTCDKDKYRRVTIYCGLPFIITLMHLALSSEKMELEPQSTAQEVIHGILHRREFSLDSCPHLQLGDDAYSFGDLVSDFISKIGIGDPHRVVFHLPGESSRVHVFGQLNYDTSGGKKFQNEPDISNELLKSILRLLRKYLMDNSVDIVDMKSQVLRGHSKGVNLELVQNSLLELERKFEAEEISVEKSDIWKTHGKSFETWICSLAYALIGYCDDIILRLCQEIVLQKAEVAEILFPNVMVNLAGRKNLDFDLCKLISSKVLENIFVKSNVMVKSIQVMLSALNEVRLCHLMERTSSSVLSSKQESSKGIDKTSSYNSRSRLSVKLKDSASTSTELVISSSLWEKVYWLAIDYLVVAKSAISCGSYFTAVFPDFSDLELLPLHIEILSSKLSSQIITFEHDGNWSKALEYYDLQDEMRIRKPYKGLIRSLQQLGCTHVLDLYSQGLTSRKGRFQHDFEFTELQYEAAWRTGNWDFSLLYDGHYVNLRQLYVRVQDYHRLAAALHEFKSLSAGKGITQNNLYLIGRIEEAKLLRGQSTWRSTSPNALFRNCEESLNSNEWQAVMPVKETRGPIFLIRRLKSSSKGDKSDYSIKIQKLQKQLSMYREEAEKLQQDKDNLLSIALEGYKHCLVIGDKYDIRVMHWKHESITKLLYLKIYLGLVVQVYTSSLPNCQGAWSFQFALVSLLKKIAIDHPYHTVFQLLALENGDRI